MSVYSIYNRFNYFYKKKKPTFIKLIPQTLLTLGPSSEKFKSYNMQQIITFLFTCAIILFAPKQLPAQVYLWSHHTGDTSVNGDYANEIRFDNNGNSIVCGIFHGTIHLDPNNSSTTLTSSGSHDAFFAKYDPNGTFIFQKNITGPSYESIYAMDIDGNGNIFITGTFASTADLDPSNAVASVTSYGNSSDIFIAKYDANGNYKWGKSIGSVGNTDNGLDLCVDNQGSVMVTGHFTGSVTFDPSNIAANRTALGGMDAFVVKYDSTGNFKWVNTIGSAAHWERGKKIHCDANNNVFVTGEFASVIDIDPSAAVMNISPIGGTDGDIFIIKYNSTGSPQWAKSMGVNGQLDIEPSICLHQNSIYLAGYAQDSMDFDLGTGSYYLPSSSYYKMYVAKYDQNMQLIWAKQFQDSAYSVVSNLQFDNQENIVLTGEFNSYNSTNFDVDLSASTYYLNGDSTAFYNFFVAKYDSNMNFKNAFQINQSSYGYITSQDIDANNNVAICGHFKDTIYLNPSNTSTLAISQGEWDLFMGKYAFSSPNAIQHIVSNNQISIYPNPVNDYLYINTKQLSKYKITNSMGQTIEQGTITNPLCVAKLPRGVYYLNIENNSVKFVKE